MVMHSFSRTPCLYTLCIQSLQLCLMKSTAESLPAQCKSAKHVGRNPIHGKASCPHVFRQTSHQISFNTQSS
ncbi:hypothetical protein EDD16DRAFT_350332 [Pisolithus croceorrhizus]|nr:hypothetical protein EDD16DRAFT_350332 [Pisolithus croceorrhizus]